MTRRRRGAATPVLLAVALSMGGLSACGQQHGPTRGATSDPVASLGVSGTSSAPRTPVSRTLAPASRGPLRHGAASAGVPGGSVPAPKAVVNTVVPALRPLRLTMPSIGVDTVLVDLGIASDGTLQVPSDFNRAGWLDTSPAPGQRGPAVLAGHVDSTTGPAIFYRLRDLAVGDPIAITRRNGTRVTFTVDAVQRYAKAAFPTAAVYGPVPGPALRLLTCGGSFDPKTGHYRDNVVVYAT